MGLPEDEPSHAGHTSDEEGEAIELLAADLHAG